MDCSRFSDNIFAFRDGTLSEGLRQASETHLASCETCNKLLIEFDNMEAIIELEKTIQPNPFTATRILQRIEREFSRPDESHFPRWTRVLQPVAIAVALLCGILIGSHTAEKDNLQSNQLVSTSNNIELLRSNLFISDFTDEDKILVLNK